MKKVIYRLLSLALLLCAGIMSWHDIQWAIYAMLAAIYFELVLLNNLKGK